MRDPGRRANHRHGICHSLRVNGDFVTGAPPTTPMRLADLVREIPVLEIRGSLDRRVRSVAYDSRVVEEGDVFVAIPGLRQDGAWFIESAIANGAAAVVTEPSGALDAPGATMVQVADARRALALLASTRWGHPSRKLGLVGVTGTDGKTTTATLIANVLEAAGEPAGLWSTVEVRGSRQIPNHAHRTTPEAPELQAHLADVLSAGCRWSVLEVSSHALALERVHGCEFDVAVMTNLAPEHLDFHRTFDAYRATKTRLFEAVTAGAPGSSRRFGVVNADDPNARAFTSVCPVEVFSYGLSRGADVRARDITQSLDGCTFTVDTPHGEYALKTSLVGLCNVYNWLAAITVAMGQGLGWEAIERAAELTRPIHGRYQQIRVGQPFTVLVDFAHTPQALAALLRDCRALAPGRVIVVLGHPGERYAANRGRLGATAIAAANLVIVTSDDCYGEQPDGIIDAIAGGARRAGGLPGRNYLVIRDRREAIQEALARAGHGDVVVIAGRGHLDTLDLGDREVPFSDALVARECLEALPTP